MNHVHPCASFFVYSARGPCFIKHQLVFSSPKKGPKSLPSEARGCIFPLRAEAMATWSSELMPATTAKKYCGTCGMTFFYYK